MFKKKKSIRLSYARQGLIYFTCLTYSIQPVRVQKKIINLAKEVAGEDFPALLCVLTRENKTIEAVAREKYLSEKYLANLRAVFYEEYSRRYLGKS